MVHPRMAHCYILVWKCISYVQMQLIVLWTQACKSYLENTNVIFTHTCLQIISRVNKCFFCMKTLKILFASVIFWWNIWWRYPHLKLRMSFFVLVIADSEYKTFHLFLNIAANRKKKGRIKIYIFIPEIKREGEKRKQWKFSVLFIYLYFLFCVLLN